MLRRLFALFCIAALAAAAPIAPAALGQQREPVTVFAAASLADAMTEIAEAYEAETGQPVRLSFAASSTLARQIEAGAPADVYASANVRWMDWLAERGRIDPASRTQAIYNALVWIAPSESPLSSVEVSEDLDLPGLLGPDGRLAVGDPAHVPAGTYAREALETYGLWDAAEPRLAPAADVRAALALVARGEAPLGVVYRTDAAIEDDVKVLGEFPADCHAPIVYPFALIGPAPSPAARRFFEYLTGSAGGAVFSAYGFVRMAAC